MQRGALDEVEHAPDGAHHDLPAVAQLRLLGADRGAAPAAVQDERGPLDEVQHAPDGTHHDLPAVAQLRLLGADRSAAEDGDHVDSLALGVGTQRLRDLDAQLARRREDEPLHLGLGGVDVLDHRQTERGGLARARLRLADHVAPLQEDGDGLLLDGAGLLVAHVL